jgi:uncharacterized membrane protein
MKKLFNKYNIIDIGFHAGLFIKAINALIEFVCGFLFMILSHDKLKHLIELIALPELSEDPTDIIMNYFITFGQNFSMSSQHSAAIYLLLHGIVKLVVIWLLLKKKLWAYPLSMGLFGLLISYELYSYLQSHSILMLLAIALDIVVIFMIILEYKSLKSEKS